MKRVWLFLICAVVLIVGLACGPAGTVAGAGDGGPVGESTGDVFMLNGDGCPSGYAYVRSGGSYGGCTFKPRNIYLTVYCGGDSYTFNLGDSGPVWRSDGEPSKRGLTVFWPGGDGVDGQGFACVKERCVDCD